MWASETPQSKIACSASQQMSNSVDIQKYLSRKILARAPSLRRWIFRQVPLNCTMTLGNNGLTHDVAISNNKENIIFVRPEKPGRIYVSECSGNQKTLKRALVKCGKLPCEINSISLNPAKDCLLQIMATSKSDSTAGLWQGKNGQLLYKLRHHNSTGSCKAVFNNNGTHILTVENSCALVHSFDTSCQEHVKLEHKLIGHNSLISSAIFNDEGTIIATGSHDGSVHLWDVATGTCCAVLDLSLKGKDFPILAFNHAGTRLAVACYDNVKIIEILTHTETCGKKSYSTEIIQSKEGAYVGPCKCIQFTDQSGDFFETVGADSCTRHWSLKELNAIDNEFTALSPKDLELMVELCQHRTNKPDEPFVPKSREQWDQLPQQLKSLLSSHLQSK